LSLARRGLLPQALARTNRRGAPAAAATAILAAAVLFIAGGLLIPSDRRFKTLFVAGTAQALLLVCVYTGLALGALRLMLRSPSRQPVWRWVVFPAAAVVPLLALYGTFVPFPEFPERYGLHAGLLTIGLVTLWAVRGSSREPETRSQPSAPGWPQTGGGHVARGCDSLRDNRARARDSPRRLKKRLGREPQEPWRLPGQNPTNHHGAGAEALTLAVPWLARRPTRGSCGAHEDPPRRDGALQSVPAPLGSVVLCHMASELRGASSYGPRCSHCRWRPAALAGRGCGPWSLTCPWSPRPNWGRRGRFFVPTHPTARMRPPGGGTWRRSRRRPTGGPLPNTRSTHGAGRPTRPVPTSSARELAPTVQKLHRRGEARLRCLTAARRKALIARLTSHASAGEWLRKRH
jgi:hypothetical protein